MDDPAPSTPADRATTSSAARPASLRWRRRAFQIWTRARRLGPVGILGAIALTFPPLGGFLLLAGMVVIGPWLDGLGTLGWFVYVGAFMVLAGLALLPTYAQALLGGYAFGLYWGSAGALLGFTGAAMIGYFIARYFSGDRAIRMLEENAKWKAVYQELLRSNRWKTLLLVTLVRLPPNSPFALTNVVFAAGAVYWPVYAAGTAIGMAPRTVAAVVIAHMFREQFSLDELMRNPFGQWWLGAGLVLTIIVVIIIGQMANRALDRVTANARNGAGRH